MSAPERIRHAVVRKLTVGGANLADAAAALGALDGVTASTAELNLLDGVTATTAELNILDGVTSSAAELSILTGVTATSTEINKLAGVTAGTAAASKAAVLGASKQLSGLARPMLSKSADYTVTAADSNSVIVVTGVDKVMTLPATAPGLMYTFVLAAGGLSAGTGLSISPAATDKIMGNGFTSADNKDAILAGSGDREGDSLSIVGDAAGDGWYITGVTGTWTRET